MAQRNKDKPSSVPLPLNVVQGVGGGKGVLYVLSVPCRLS